MEVEQREEHHFAADEYRRDAEVDVIVGEFRAGFHGTGDGEDGEDERLQRAQADDAFDREELGNDLVFFKLCSHSAVEFQQSEQSESDGDCVDDCQL